MKGEKMAEVFKCFGIAIAVLIADSAFCTFIDFVTLENIDEWWIFPLVVNTLGFVAMAAILIAQNLGG